MFRFSPRAGLLALILRSGVGVTSAAILAAGCSKEADGTLILGNGEVVVSGTIVRQETAASYNEPFLPGEGSHVVISFRRIGAAADSAPSFEADAPASALPIPFEVRGRASEIFPDAGSPLQVSAAVYAHAGLELQVGDLASEETYTLAKAGDRLDVQVLGLEPCSAVGSAGPCVTEP